MITGIPQTGTGRLFFERVNARGEGADELVPADHLIDWGDKPYGFKLYNDPVSIALPAPKRLSEAAVFGSPIEKLSSLLCLLGAPLYRKMSINWNDGSTAGTGHADQQYSRATASGGGLYPAEFYLCIEGIPALRPGVFHYNGVQHSLVQIAPGPAATRVRGALPEGAANCSVYLLVSIEFWKSAFKYHNFAYHVCGQDAGAAVATAAHACAELGIGLEVHFWFEDRAVNQIAGLDTAGESVYVVLGLEMDPAPPLVLERDEQEQPGRVNGLGAIPGAGGPVERQRSMRTFVTPILEQVHVSSLITGEELAGIRLEPAAHEDDLRRQSAAQQSSSWIFERRSSWGGMRSHPDLKESALLQFLNRVVDEIVFARSLERLLVSSTGSSVTGADLLRFVVFANHVAGLERGLYRYSEGTSTLVPYGPPEAAEMYLQQFYRLDNYNWEQASCLLFPVGGVAKALESYGDRGVRILNMQAGIAAQTTYRVSAQSGLECGAVLGLRLLSLNRWLQLEEGTETVLVALLLGNGLGNIQLFDTFFQHELTL